MRSTAKTYEVRIAYLRSRYGTNCPKYRPRKNNQKKESVRDKRQKDKDRHDQWKKDKF